MAREIRADDRVRILRGAWCNYTALVIAESPASVKVRIAGSPPFDRWYARSEVEARPMTPVLPNSGEAESLPVGIEDLPPQVKIGPCAECGRESGEEFYVVVDRAGWEEEIERIGWRIEDGRLLCFDCMPPRPNTRGGGSR